MSTEQTTAHTPGALRAAAQVVGFSGSREWIDSDGEPSQRVIKSLARIIDRETGLPELLALLKEANRRLQTLAVFDAATFDQQPRGTPRLKSFSESISAAIAEAEGKA